MNYYLFLALKNMKVKGGYKNLRFTIPIVKKEDYAMNTKKSYNIFLKPILLFNSF